MFHLLSWVSEAFSDTSYASVTPLTDTVFGTKNQQFVYGGDLRLFAAQMLCTGLDGVKLSTPSMRGIGAPVLRPWIAQSSAQNDPNLALFLERPLLLRAGEEIKMEAKVTGGTPNAYGLAWVTQSLRPAPMGDIITLDVSTSVPSTANIWTEVLGSLDWQESATEFLPNGNYAVVGCEHISSTALAYRWIFDNQPFRPGGLSQADTGTGPILTLQKMDLEPFL